MKLKLCFISTLILCACAHSQSDNAGFDMSPSELANKMHSASLGNAEDACAVSEYYTFIKYDNNEAIKWMRIAAVAGMPMAKHNLGVMLSASESEADKKESQKWLDEAAKEGVTAPTK